MELTTKNYNPAMSDDITKLAAAFLLAKNDFRATGQCLEEVVRR